MLGQFFLKKHNVLSHAMMLREGSRLDDPNQNTHPRMSAHHEDPQRAVRQMSAAIFKKTNAVGENAISTVRF